MIKILQAFSLAFKSIAHNKMRSFLTMLGLIIGVGSVIILVGLMNGVTDYIVAMFADMGTNMVTVSVTNTDSRYITDEDAYAICEKYDSLFEGVTPSVSGSFTVKNGETSLEREAVTGVGEDYNVINHINVENGRFIAYGDIETRNRVCVIGTYIATELFGTVDAVGETLKIDGNGFTVIGVLEEQDDSTDGSADECVYIPYSTGARMNWSSSATTFIFATPGTDYIEQAETILDEEMYAVYKDESLYTVTSMSSLLDSVNEITGMLSMILSGIAGISLLVAGIGIMNIMLVSVVERTREIGIRKALGATRGNILLQFIIEAATVSGMGGIIGIIFGEAVCVVVGSLFGVDASAGPDAIALAFGVAAGIGIFFGFMPARRAAKLHPIDALRTE